MNTKTTAYTFAPDAITCKGKTFPVEYALQPSGTVTAFVQLEDRRVRVRFDEGAAEYPAARAAAEAARAAWTAARTAAEAAPVAPAHEDKPAEVKPAAKKCLTPPDSFTAGGCRAGTRNFATPTLCSTQSAPKISQPCPTARNASPAAKLSSFAATKTHAASLDSLPAATLPTSLPPPRATAANGIPPAATSCRAAATARRSNAQQSFQNRRAAGHCTAAGGFPP